MHTFYVVFVLTQGSMIVHPISWVVPYIIREGYTPRLYPELDRALVDAEIYTGKGCVSYVVKVVLTEEGELAAPLEEI